MGDAYDEAYTQYIEDLGHEEGQRMSSKIEAAFNELMLELHHATGMPNLTFTIVLTVQPVTVFDDNGKEEGISYHLTKIVINEEMWDAKFQ